MSIEFYQKQIEEYENHRFFRERQPYIGYFNPEGKLINYNVLFSQRYVCDHGSYINPVSQKFILYLSYILNDSSIRKLQNWKDKINSPNKKLYKYPGVNQIVFLGGIDPFNLFDEFFYSNTDNTFNKMINLLEDDIKTLEQKKEKCHSLDDYNLFIYDLLLFFRNAYSNKRFFDSIDKKICIEKIHKIYPSYDKITDYSKNEHTKREYIEDYVIPTLMSYFKDICVQYLGYDSLERFMPNGNIVPVRQNYDDESIDFLKTPRIITTSNPNINERFFNYLLMDWRVDILPKYRFNPNTHKYEEDEIIQYHTSSMDEEYGKEIAKIKKLVPLTERPKYFR